MTTRNPTERTPLGANPNENYGLERIMCPQGLINCNKRINCGAGWWGFCARAGTGHTV